MLDYDRTAPTALLADRDPDSRVMYAEFLRLAAYAVEEASDGRDALAKALSRHPDIFVTETRLPGLSGFDLCELLRHDPATRTIPILFVTADAYPQDLARARRAGADSILIKPCLPEQLLCEMQRLVRHSQDLRQRSESVRTRATDEIERAQLALQKADALQRRCTLSRAHQRLVTTYPAAAPPALICPACDHLLVYQRSHIGGVSARHSEQWDYYECSN